MPIANGLQKCNIHVFSKNLDLKCLSCLACALDEPLLSPFRISETDVFIAPMLQFTRIYLTHVTFF